MKKKKRKYLRDGCWWITPVTISTWEAVIWRTMVLGQPGQIVCETPISKITRANWTGGVAQAVEHPLCKYKTLSSNSIPQKKKKERKEKTNILGYDGFLVWHAIFTSSYRNHS
jgi:hypothetical protein